MSYDLYFLRYRNLNEIYILISFAWEVFCFSTWTRRKGAREEEESCFYFYFSGNRRKDAENGFRIIGILTKEPGS